MAAIVRAAGFAGALLLSFTALSQESLPGAYQGAFEVHTNLGIQSVGVTLKIDAVDDGKVKGVATMGGRACAGDYPVEGTLKGQQIAVRATQKGGRAGDCSFAFAGTVDGNRLVGKMGKYDVELRK